MNKDGSSNGKEGGMKVKNVMQMEMCSLADVFVGIKWQYSVEDDNQTFDLLESVNRVVSDRQRKTVCF